MLTIPRGEIHVIADRHDSPIADAFSTDPTVDELRSAASRIRSLSEVLTTLEARKSTAAEADDLDALADRYEREAA
jgi:hypothetical protein